MGGGLHDAMHFKRSLRELMEIYQTKPLTEMPKLEQKSDPMEDFPPQSTTQETETEEYTTSSAMTPPKEPPSSNSSPPNAPNLAKAGGDSSKRKKPSYEQDENEASCMLL